MKYFTSDTHYFHKNIITYSNRPYETVEEMNSSLVANWNSCVKADDEIYHLGDVGFTQEEPLFNLLSQLNGRKVLILGNHDQVVKKSKPIKDLFDAVLTYHEVDIDDPISKGGRRKVVLCHYPMLTWNKAHYGSLMLHGHCHGTLTYPFQAKIMDVGVDPQNYFPISEKQALSKLQDAPYRRDRAA